MTVHVRAPAKLNLFLNVVGRRADGYHLLDSLFAFTELADVVTAAMAEDLSLRMDGEWSAGLDAGGDNLVMRAAALLRDEAAVAAGAALMLRKNVPVAAGLGGGSADAAAALKALNRLWGLNWPLSRLQALAGRLGADVPACLSDRPVMARGVGDELSPAPEMPSCSLLLANPRRPTPTPKVFAAYRALNPEIPGRTLPPLPDRWESLAALAAHIRMRGNDLLPAALLVTPEIGPTLAALEGVPGAAAAGLSGSGATCFALFADDEAANAAGEKLRHDHPDWWFWRPDEIMG